MHDDQLIPIQRITGQVRAMFYLVDEPITTLMIQTGERTITARASGQVALDLRAPPRGATSCATLYNTQIDIQIMALAIRLL